MKKNIFIKIIFLILILLSIININKYVFAADSIDGFIQDADSFLEGGKAEGETLIDKTGMQDISSLIYNTLLAIGMIIAVAIGIFLGIMIMSGSIEEQAKYKQLLLPYFIGCLVIFGAFGIWKIIVNILQSSI